MMKTDKIKKYRIIVWGGLGDGVILTPTFKAIKLREPSCRIIAYVYGSHKEILLHNPHIDRIVSFYWFKSKKPKLSWLKIRNPFASIRFLLQRHRFHILAYGQYFPSIFDKDMHATAIVGKMLNLDIKDTQVHISITKEEDRKAQAFLSQYKNPVLIQITSACSSNQNWSVEKWEELIRRMPDHTFLQLGNIGETRIKGAVDLLGQTTIRGSMALLKNARSFVGVDSFLNNASNAFLTKGVVLFGPSPPQIWGYHNNINIYGKTTCSPCIDLLGKDPCPYNAECMKKITVDEVEEALKIQLGINVEKAVIEY